MSATPFVNAFIKWANTFESVKVEDSKGLENAAVFKNILLDVGRDYFRQIEIEEDVDNWLLSLHNLKRVYNAAKTFYTEVLQKVYNSVDPNLPAIAKAGSIHDIELFARLVLAIAVQCEDRQRYIKSIQSLDHRSQRQLMIGIEEMLDPGKVAQPSVLEYQAITDNASILIEEEFSKMLAERNKAEGALRELLEKHSQLKTEHQALQVASERSRTAHNDDSTTDYLSTIADLEERLNHALVRREKEESNVATLNRNIAEMQPLLQNQSEMQTKLDDAMDQIKNLRKVENVVEKYKRKLEDLSDVQRKLKSSEEQNVTLSDKILKNEHLSARNFENTGKHQISKLEDDVSSLRSQRDQTEAELLFTRQLLEKTKTQRMLDLERIAELEEQLRNVDIETEPHADGRPERNRLASEISDWQLGTKLNAVTNAGSEDTMEDTTLNTAGPRVTLPLDTLLHNVALFADFMEDFTSKREKLQELTVHILEKEVGEQYDLRASITSVLDQCKQSEEIEKEVGTHATKLLHDIRERPSTESRMENSSKPGDQQLTRHHMVKDVNSLYLDLLNRTQLHSITLRRAYEDPVSWLAKQRNDSEKFLV